MAKPALPSEAALLKEYEMALTFLESINTVAYTGTGLFLTVSLAGAAWFLRPGAHVAWETILGAGVAGVFASFLVLYWRRWIETLRIQNAISAFRCREIEGTLGLRLRTYFSDIEAVTYASQECADHGYVHTSREEAVEHLWKHVEDPTTSTIFSPFKRLWTNKKVFYRPRKVGNFWDVLAFGIPCLWVAVFLVNLAIRLSCE